MTLPNGQGFTVYVDADGQITHIIPDGDAGIRYDGSDAMTYWENYIEYADDQGFTPDDLPNDDGEVDMSSPQPAIDSRTGLRPTPIPTPSRSTRATSGCGLRPRHRSERSWRGIPSQPMFSTGYALNRMQKCSKLNL